MIIDPKKLAADLKKRNPKKATISLFVDPQIYKDFKEVCTFEGLGTSMVLEELMRQFVEAAKKK